METLVIKGYNSRRRKCKACGEEFFGHGRYCHACFDQLRRPLNYSEANYEKRGKWNKYFWGLSIEFETALKYDAAGQLELMKWGFIPTSDSSVDGIEWKSPIYGNFQSFRYMVNFLDRLLKMHPNLIDNSCGTHIHVGVPDKDEFSWDWLYEVFGPITTFMRSTPNITREIWGRPFNSYATANLDFSDHYSWFNINTRYNTIEWRLPVFVTAKQFYRLAKWCAGITKWLWEVRTHDEDSVALALLKKYKEVCNSVQVNAV